MEDPIVLRYSSTILGLMGMLATVMVGLTRWAFKHSTRIAILERDVKRIDESHVTRPEIARIDQTLSAIQEDISYLRSRIDSVLAR
jgi:hypothetical protein